MGIAAAQEAYAAKLAARPRAEEQLDDEQFALFEQDLARAWRELEVEHFRMHPERR